MKTILLKILLLLFVAVWPGIVNSQTINTTAGNITSCPGEIQIPIYVTNCNGIGAISLMLNYDNTKLTYLGYQNLNTALTSGLLIINSTGSKVIISWANTTAANIGNDTLVKLRFNAITSTTNLTWDNLISGNCEYSDVNNNILTATYTNGTATINQLPSMTTQATDKSILVGQNTSFSIGAVGSGLVYQWQFSSNGGSSWTDLTNTATYSGVTTSTLGISNAQLAINGYKFKCRITGSCLPVIYSNEVMLTVSNPVITSLPTNSFCPGSIVVPVAVSNFNSIASFSLTFNYSSACLTYTGYQSFNSNLNGGNFVINSTGSKIIMSWSSTTAVSFGTDTIIKLLFNAVTGSCTLNWDISTEGACEYSNINGTLFTTVFNNGNETIYAIPSISGNPSNSTIAKGQNTSFSISAGGTGLSYVWQVSSNGGSSYTDLTNAGYYSNVNGTTLNISNAQLAISNYKYRCKVSGSCNPAVYSNPATLLVLPNIISNCGSATVCPGQMIIPVTVTDFTGVASFSLTLNYPGEYLTFTGYQNLNTACSNGNIIANAVNNKVYITWSRVTSANITNGDTLIKLIFNAIPGSGSLTWNTQTTGNCEYADLDGNIIFSTWNNGSFTVNTPPYITSEPVNKTIYATGSTTFSVTAGGTGLGYQWQVSSNNGNSWANASGPYTGINTSTLTVNPANPGMNGYLYRCRVSGSCSPEDTSSSANLTVTQAPVTTTSGTINNSCTGNISVPVNVLNCNNIGSISLTMIFDTSLMSFEGYHSLNSSLNNGLLTVNRSANKVFMTWAATTAVTIGSGTLIQYRFKANAGISTTLSWDTQSAGACEYSDADGNIITAIFNSSTVSIIANALIVNAGRDTTLAPGGSTQLNGLINGGVAPVTYSWTPSAGLSNPAILNPIATPSSTTIYTLTATGNSTCTGTDAMTVYIVSTPLPAGNISGITTVCQGQNGLTYSVPGISGATSYIWTLPTGASGTSSTNSISVNYGISAVSGNISVMGHNSSGDGTPSNLAITVNPLPNANAGNDLLVCSGDTVILNASGGTSYIWNNGVLQNTPFVPELTQTYIVQVSNQFNCTKNDTVLITVSKKLMIVNAFLEGLYAGGNMMNNAYNDLGVPEWGMNVADMLTLEIRNGSIPYTILQSLNLGLNLNGEVKSFINCNNTGLYYIVLKHRNHIETWSSAPISFAGDTVTYNFTTAASNAFGDNQIQVAPGVFAIYAGDVNQDGLVDGSDMSDTETDNNNFVTGYVVTDVNGDGLVDGSDMSVVETANNNFVGVVAP